MTEYKKRHSFQFKAIALVALCLFFINTIAWAYPDNKINISKTNLATQSVFQPLRDEGIQDSSELVFELIAGIRLLLAGKSTVATNGFLTEMYKNLPEDGRKIKFIEYDGKNDVIRENNRIKAKFIINEKEDIIFEIEYLDTKTDPRSGDISVQDARLLETDPSKVLRYTDVFQKNDVIVIGKTGYEPPSKFATSPIPLKSPSQDVSTRTREPSDTSLPTQKPSRGNAEARISSLNATRIIETFLHRISIFLLVAVTALFSAISCRDKGTAPEKAPAASESGENVQKKKNKLDLWSLPAKDIYYILQLHNQDFMLYEWYKKAHPDMSKGRFCRYLRELDDDSFKKLLKAYLASDEGKKYLFMVGLVKNTEKLIASEEFRREFNEINEILNLENANMPFYEIYRFFNQTPLMRQKYLYILKTLKFREFHTFLKETYRINPNNRLIDVLELYLHPTSLKELRSKNTQEAFKIFKKHFPEFAFDSIDYIMALQKISNLSARYNRRGFKGNLEVEMKSGAYEQMVKRLASNCKFIVDQYGMKITTLRNFHRFFDDAVQDRIEGLRANHKLAKEIYDYYKNHYPGRIEFKGVEDFVGGWPNFYEHFVKPIIDLRTTPQELDRFFKIFGVSLAEQTGHELSFELKIKNVVENIDYLARNRNFRNFVSSLLERYPALRKKMSKPLVERRPFVPYIVLAFRNKAAFERLNAAINSFDKFATPEFDLRYAKLKIEILNLVKRKFGKVELSQEYVDSVKVHHKIFSSSGAYSEEAYYREALRLLNSEEAEKLYSTLFEHWKVRSLSLYNFLEVLVHKKRRDFYLNVENARKFIELKDKYSFFAPTLDELSLWAIDLLEHYAFYAKDEVANFIKKYYASSFDKQVKSKRGIRLFDFIDLRIHRGLKDFDIKEIERLAELLVEKYGFDTNEAGRIFKNGEIKITLKHLKDTGTLAAFKKLRDFFKNTQVSNSYLLNWAIKIKDRLTKTISLAELLESKFNLNIHHISNFEYFIKFILPQKNICKNIENPNFQQFYRRVTKIFTGNYTNIQVIVELSEVYDRMSEKQLKILFSPTINRVISFINSNFHISDFHFSYLPSLIAIAEDFDETRWVNILKRLKAQGERISPNDLVLLDRILKNPKLQKRLFDKASLIQDAKKIYRRRAYPRQLLMTEELKRGYTERPDLSSLSNMMLLRMNLLYESLQNPKVLRAIGDIVYRDVNDKTTEYGGLFRISNGLATPHNVRSHSENDAAYMSPKYLYFIDGICTFHLHALELDMSQYSGPSGFIDWYEGDVPFVDCYDLVDVVITTMGHPVNGKGKPNKNKIKINIDMYWIDKTDPAKKRVITVDMGSFNVPYGALDERQTGKNKQIKHPNLPSGTHRDSRKTVGLHDLNSKKKTKPTKNQHNFPRKTVPRIGKHAAVKEIIGKRNGKYAKVVDAKEKDKVLGELALKKGNNKRLTDALESLTESTNQKFRGMLMLFTQILQDLPPPEFYTFSESIRDLFGFAFPENNLIAIHREFASNPLVHFHEIGHYLIELEDLQPTGGMPKKGLLDLRLIKKDKKTFIRIRARKYFNQNLGDALDIEMELSPETIQFVKDEKWDVSWEQNPHYLLRLMQIEMFWNVDKKLTEEIKAKRLFAKHKDERMLLVKTREFLKNYPINESIDLSLIPREEAQLEQNMETLARMIAWHNTFGFDIRYILLHEKDKEYEQRAKALLRSKLDHLVNTIPGLNLNIDRILTPHDIAEKPKTIEIQLRNIDAIKKMHTIPERTYPVALKEDDKIPGVSIPNYTAASAIGLSLAALRVAKEEKPEEYSEKIKRTIKTFRSVYVRHGLNAVGFTEDVLDMMVNGSSNTRLEYIILYALPPIVKDAIEKINEYHRNIQLLLQAA